MNAPYSTGEFPAPIDGLSDSRGRLLRTMGVAVFLLFFQTYMIAFPILSLAMATAPGLNALLLLRVVSGLTNVGMVVIGLSLIGDQFPPTERGRAIGWVFGAVAGGCSFGSTFGGLLALTHPQKIDPF